MNQFRTRNEVSEIYGRLSAEGISERPYIVEAGNDQQLLTFFGANHTNEPDDPQWEELENHWQRFLQHDNPHRVVIHERSVSDDEAIEDMDTKQAIKTFSESGWIVKAAQAAGVQAEWGEPDRIEEIAYLKERFTVPQIITYYFGRQMHQWWREDRANEPDWQTYATEALGHYNALHFWGGEELTLDKALAWYQENIGKAFDPEDGQALYDVSDPAKSEVSAASGLYRDEWLYDKIAGHWQQGKDVFVVYGNGHAIVQEPALRQLAERQG